MVWGRHPSIMCAGGSKKAPLGSKIAKHVRLADVPKSKMIPNDQYNMLLIIWGHFGSIWTLFEYLRQNLISCSKSLWPRITFCFWGKISIFDWNDPKAPCNEGIFNAFSQQVLCYHFTEQIFILLSILVAFRYKSKSHYSNEC